MTDMTVLLIPNTRHDNFTHSNNHTGQFYTFQTPDITVSLVLITCFTLSNNRLTRYDVFSLHGFMDAWKMWSSFLTIALNSGSRRPFACCTVHNHRFSNDNVHIIRLVLTVVSFLGFCLGQHLFQSADEGVHIYRCHADGCSSREIGTRVEVAVSTKVLKPVAADCGVFARGHNSEGRDQRISFYCSTVRIIPHKSK